MNRKVDAFVERATKWQSEFKKLRKIILEFDVLTEDLKWGQPCYAYEGKNVVLMHGFKEYCALLFHKGALMKDPKGILIQQTENVQAARQIRFTNLQSITKIEKTLKSYIQQAIDIEKAGLRVTFKKASEYKVPDEFKARLDASPSLKKAFQALTPGRQRGYLFYFSQPKQSTTRESRIDKCVPRIRDGLGLDD
jgi:uncharacterized protein YdeI (YjbR/CyaY-like superfamily)